MKAPTSVKSLENLGRVQLSKNYFMRDFLYSEISQIENIPNIPDYPDVAIEAGRNLCCKLLEPIEKIFGRVSVRSGYRSPSVNSKGAENGNQYNCASNKKNYGKHIWDYRDEDGCLGATACVVVNSFIPYYENTNHWQALAWWVHDNVPEYSEMYFFPKLAAFNLTWSEQPKKIIKSHIVGSRGILTKPSMSNCHGNHGNEYRKLLAELRT
ncbi:peptidase M15 [Vibrio splendidus]|jgi:hypothetical protein|uniref:Peptidase M15 n=1 Tax=Vibrio splendidus TaxID=29497 RepID=A0AB35MWM6_VIBSP|nr:peptidase M15 [Vibrio splendidus]MDP2501070.1 peptidase M15 [Vibrio splendidus]PMK43648.1 peptidase M15 [Vibrio splendidus]PMM68745.1 peptidase M15 [Vibrio splendidus]